MKKPQASEKECSDLLGSLENQPPEESLRQLQQFREAHSLEARPDTELWILAQEIWFQEGRLALETGVLWHCLEALKNCAWSEADQLISRAVLLAVGKSDYGESPTVVKLVSGDFQVYGRHSSGQWAVGRLSFELETLCYFLVPQEVHFELNFVRFPSRSDAVGQAVARSAEVLQAAGMPDLAAGVLQARIDDYPSLGDRKFSLKDLFKRVHPKAQSWLAAYLEEEASNSGKPRMSPDQARQQRIATLRYHLRSESAFTDERVLSWVRRADASELLELMHPNLARILALLEPERARRVLQTGTLNVPLIDAMLAASENPERTLEEILEGLVGEPEGAGVMDLQLRQAEVVARGIVFLENKKAMAHWLERITSLRDFQSSSAVGERLREVYSQAGEFTERCSAAPTSPRQYVVDLKAYRIGGEGDSYCFLPCGSSQKAVKLCQRSRTADFLDQDSLVCRTRFQRTVELVFCQNIRDIASDTVYSYSLEFRSGDEVVLTLEDAADERFAEWERALPQLQSELKPIANTLAEWLYLPVKSSKTYQN